MIISLIPVTLMILVTLKGLRVTETEREATRKTRGLHFKATSKEYSKEGEFQGIKEYFQFVSVQANNPN